METPDEIALDVLRELVCSLVSECIDGNLLDLISRILAQSSAGLPG